MKTPLSLLLCLATFPLLTSAQTISATATGAPGLSSGTEIQNSLFQALPFEKADLRVEKKRPQDDESSSLRNSKWEAPIRETLPRVSLGGKSFPVSGFLVNAFGPTPSSAVEYNWSDRIFGRSNSFKSLPFAERRLEYLKWGEREEPWSALCDRSRPALEGALFSLQF